MGPEAVRFLVLWMAGWIHSRQLEVTDFLREENNPHSHAYCVGKIHHARRATLPTAASCGRAACQVARGARCRSGARIALSWLRLGGRIAALGIAIGELTT